jgi:hypothetical protein
MYIIQIDLRFVNFIKFLKSTYYNYYYITKELENLSLYEVASLYDYKKSMCHSGCFVLREQLGYLHIRNSKKIIKLPFIDLKSDDAIEKIYFQKLLMFLPWRAESKLKGTYLTYKEAFEKLDLNSINNNILQIFEIHRKRAYEITESINKINSAQVSDSDKKEVKKFNEKGLGIADFNSNIVVKSVLENNISMLNIEQRQIFDTVISVIENKDVNIKPLRLFCSGVGGNIYL